MLSYGATLSRLHAFGGAADLGYRLYDVQKAVCYVEPDAALVGSGRPPAVFYGRLSEADYPGAIVGASGAVIECHCGAAGPRTGCNGSSLSFGKRGPAADGKAIISHGVVDTHLVTVLRETAPLLSGRVLFDNGSDGFANGCVLTSVCHNCCICCASDTICNSIFQHSYREAPIFVNVCWTKLRNLAWSIMHRH